MLTQTQVGAEARELARLASRGARLDQPLLGCRSEQCGGGRIEAGRNEGENHGATADCGIGDHSKAILPLTISASKPGLDHEGSAESGT